MKPKAVKITHFDIATGEIKELTSEEFVSYFPRVVFVGDKQTEENKETLVMILNDKSSLHMELIY